MTTAYKTRDRLTVKGLPALPQVTVVQSGPRDAYQVALALEEAGMLSRLVTDLFWPSDKPWARIIADRLPAKLRSQIEARSLSRIPSSKVRQLTLAGVLTLLVEKLSARNILPQSLSRRRMRHSDALLGSKAGQLATQNKTALLSYSYYAHDAFVKFSGEGMLFQMHPHPASMRRILLVELEAHPQCAASLNQEWELALPAADFDRLAAEPASARHIIAASSFTRATLVENGIPPERIHVIPYGVDSRFFVPDESRFSPENGKLRLLFVGRINQRKGIQYLVDSLRLLATDEIELKVCGRVVDDLSVFRPLGDRVQIFPNMSREGLLAAYQSSDLFVFPSVAEGFGQVLLESLACGLPILSTTRTAAPDLIESGREGFVVEPCKTTPIAERIEWALTHRKALRRMRAEARRSAEQRNWPRFRSSLAQTVAECLRYDEPASSQVRPERGERSELHAF